MSDAIAATSPAAAEGVKPAVETSDGKKSGNVSMSQVGRLMSKSSAEPAAEKITGDPAAPAQAAAPTPVAEALNASRTPESQPQAGTPPTPPPEEPAAPTAGSDEETPTDLSQLSNLDPKTKGLVESLLKQQKDHIQSLVDKRIGKEVARTKGLEEQLASLKQQQAPASIPSNGLLPAPVPVQAQFTAPVDPSVANIHDLNALAAKRLEADSYRQMADDALALGPDDSGRYNINGEPLTKEQVITIRRSASNIMNVQVPQRYQYIQARQVAVKSAYEEFPWLNDQQSPEYQQAVSIINNTPAIRALPNAEMVIGYLLEGQKALAARKKAASAPAPAAPAPKPKPPSDQTAFGGGASAPGRAGGDARVKKSLSDEIGKLGSKGKVSLRDTATFLARKDQLFQSR